MAFLNKILFNFGRFLKLTLGEMSIIENSQTYDNLPGKSWGSLDFLKDCSIGKMKSLPGVIRNQSKKF